MKKIIINADDFGINEVVTSEIERNLMAWNVSSTTIMANGGCLEEVKRFASQHPEFSYGVHLCLSEYDSLTKSEGLKRAGIIGDDGKFIHKAIFQLNNLSDTVIQKAIRDELNAQIDVISSLGIPISHADSHHHVHVIYPLKELFSEVLKERGIKRIRLGADFRTFRTKIHIRQLMRRKKLNIFYRTQFKTVDSFYSYSEFVNSGCAIKDDSYVELMCHPGHAELKYSREMNLVEDKTAIKFSDVKLISYNDLH